MIELIIYLAITSIILVSITAIMLTILMGQAKSFVGSELNYNVEYVSNFLTRDIKQANQINSISTTTLSLKQQSNDVIYRFDRDTLTLWRQYNAGVPIKMNTDFINIDGSFYDNSFSNKSKNVLVYLELIEFDDANKMSDFTATTSVIFSVELRNRK